MQGLRGARAQVEKLMLDQCVITKDPLRLMDATLDTTTGALTPNVANDIIIYRGKCHIGTPRRSLRSGAASSPTGENSTPQYYPLAIPISAPAIYKGYQVTIVSSQDKLEHVLRFTIISTGAHTMAVAREATLELAETDRDA